MRIRKSIFRTIAGALVLLLVMVGAVFANTACAGACACCGGISNAPCHMKPYTAPETLNGPVSPVPRADRSLPVALAFLNRGIYANERLSFLVTAGHLAASRTGPAPLYLHNLSLLF